MNADATELTEALSGKTGTVVLDEGRDYAIDHTVTVGGSHDLTVIQNGATIRYAVKPTTKAVMCVRLLTCVRIVWPLLRVRGRKQPDQGYVPAVEGAHGVGIFGCDHIVIEGWDVADVPGDFFYVASVGGGGPKHTARPSTQVTIAGGLGDQAGRHAVSVTGGNGVMIARNAFTNVHMPSKVVVDLEDRVRSDVQTDVHWRNMGNTIDGRPL